MTSPVDSDSWKTPEIREAEAQLQAAVQRGNKVAEEARQLAAQIRPSRISDADLRQVERAARAADAPPEMRALAEKVDRGELTWRQIADGQAMEDPAVKAAASLNLERMSEVYRQFEEGMTLEQVLEAQGLSDVGAGDDAGPDLPDDGDDDDGGGRGVLKRDSW